MFIKLFLDQGEAVDLMDHAERWKKLWDKTRTEEDLGAMARDLGHEVGRNGSGAALAFYQMFGQSIQDADSDFLRGFRFGLTECMRTYSQGRFAAEEEATTLQLAMLCGWQAYLEILVDMGAQTYNSLADTVNKTSEKPVDVSFVTQTLVRMFEEGLVQPVVGTGGPAGPRMYILTIFGRRTLEKLREQQEWLKTKWLNNKEEAAINS